MRSRWPMLLLMFTSLFSPLTTSYAQDREQTGVVLDDPTSIGLDAATFQRFFESASQTPSARATDVRESIKTFRVWFDPELAQRGVARAEIEATTPRENRQLSLTFEEEPVLFNDEGEELDRERGDRIFTAALPLELPKFLGEQAVNTRDLPEIIESLENFPQFRVREVVKDETLAGLLETLRGENELTQRFNRMRELRTEIGQMEPGQILDRLEIDPQRTPILEAVRRDTLFDVRLFDIPILVFGPLVPKDIDSAHSLMITDVAVVEDPARTFDVCSGAGDPNGPWTFAHLVREMAQGSGLTPEEFTLAWLNTWILPQATNGILVSDAVRAAQIQALIINPWIAASGGVTPDIDLFPARLLSIVNRSDLANVVGYSKAGSAGEARFVFGLLRNDASGCTPLSFTVIFEYGIKAKGCFGLKAWVKQWKDLDLNPVGSAAYNTALEAITRQFTDHGTNPSQLPNQNSLAQLRTNEIALDFPWELREFTLQGPSASTPGLLGLVTVKQTPRESLNNSPTLAAWIINNAPAILDVTIVSTGTHIVPNTFPSVINPFLGATAPTPSTLFFWNTPGIVAQPNGVELRRNFSLSTCNGCHAGETATSFTHVDPRSPGTAATLSGFLTGNTVGDPAGNPVTAQFDDLRRRQQRMADILNQSCFMLPFGFPILEMVH